METSGRINFYKCNIVELDKIIRDLQEKDKNVDTMLNEK